MTFRVGRKVVCVDVSASTHRSIRGRAAEYIEIGKVYTIRWLGRSPDPLDQHLGLHVRLVGVVRPDHPNPEYSDMPFKASRFRPVVERKTDISIFTDILRKASKPARGPAFSSPHGAST
jgi:hypothetical protein